MPANILNLPKAEANVSANKDALDARIAMIQRAGNSDPCSTHRDSPSALRLRRNTEKDNITDRKLRILIHR
jgi:hypothetical protein